MDNLLVELAHANGDFPQAPATGPWATKLAHDASFAAQVVQQSDPLSQETGLLSRFFEGLPAGGDARHKRCAGLTIEHCFAGRVLRGDGDKGLGNLPC